MIRPQLVRCPLAGKSLWICRAALFPVSSHLSLLCFYFLCVLMTATLHFSLKLQFVVFCFELHKVTIDDNEAIMTHMIATTCIFLLMQICN